MESSPIHSNESQFLESYSLQDYERPSVATDIAVFSLQTEKGTKYRTDPQQNISILLIRRGEHPFKDHWALPGGFLRMGETLEDCAFRELKEETGLTPSRMFWINSYSQPDRDPRGWIISHAYAGISTETDAALAASTDAAEARWFRIALERQENGFFCLLLQSESLQMRVLLQPVQSRIGHTRFRVAENDGLAFDHGAIIGEAMALLTRQGEEISTVFAFLPEKFTLSALQKVQETLMGISHLTPNFRRKIAAFVEETDEYTEGAGHRPARLYRRRTEPRQEADK